MRALPQPCLPAEPSLSLCWDIPDPDQPMTPRTGMPRALSSTKCLLAVDRKSHWPSLPRGRGAWEGAGIIYRC